jgi:FKBP-type peptidyl-prolyl cis-trans isomerase 2
MILTLHLPNGGSAPATVIDISEKEVVVDLNHPMAGKDLIFDIKVVAIENKTDSKTN